MPASKRRKNAKYSFTRFLMPKEAISDMVDRRPVRNSIGTDIPSTPIKYWIFKEGTQLNGPST